MATHAAFHNAQPERYLQPSVGTTLRSGRERASQAYGVGVDRFVRQCGEDDADVARVDEG